MRRAYRQNGGHAPWVRSAEEAAPFMLDHKVRCYRVTSAIGFDLVVWAGSVMTRWTSPDAP
jgi:hypothetical protein